MLINEKHDAILDFLKYRKVSMSQNPHILVVLYLRVEALRANNTGARNEAVAICDELLRQGVLDSEKYKAIQNLLLV